MDLRQIQYFLTLFEEQSVTRAAQRLNIVQPALSMQIAKLERDLGRQLFTRTPRRMIPTPAAERMDRLFRPLMQEFAQARDQVIHSGDTLGGHVRIGLVPSIGQHLLPSVLERFIQRYPKVTLSVSEGFTRNLIDLVSRGQLDLTYTNSSDRSPAVRTLPVLTEHVLFVTSLDGAQVGPRVKQSELNASRFVLTTRENGLRHIIEHVLRQEDLHLVPALEVDSILAIALLVEKGLYVSFLPESALHGLTSRYGLKLKGHVLKNPGFQRQIVASYNVNRSLGEAAKAFHQLMTGQLLAQQVRDPSGQTAVAYSEENGVTGEQLG